MERNGTIEITIDYYENSTARGSLIIFVSIRDNGAVDFFRSAVVTLDRTSNTHELKFNLLTGENFVILIYDIERDGRLHDGVNLPAVMGRYTTVANGRGKFIGQNYK